MENIILFWILAERKEDGYSIILRRTRIFLRNDVLLPGRSLVRIRIRLRMGIDWILRSTIY